MIILIQAFLNTTREVDEEELPTGWYLDHPDIVWREEQYHDGPYNIHEWKEIEPDFEKLQEVGVRGSAVFADDCIPSVFKLHLRDEGIMREEIPLKYTVGNVEWVVDFGIPLDMEDVLEVSNELCTILEDEGMERGDSGAGFGFRDMQFTTEDELMAKRAKRYAETFMRERVKGTKEEPYVSLVKLMQVCEEVEG